MARLQTEDGVDVAALAALSALCVSGACLVARLGSRRTTRARRVVGGNHVCSAAHDHCDHRHDVHGAGFHVGGLVVVVATRTDGATPCPLLRADCAKQTRPLVRRLSRRGQSPEATHGNWCAAQATPVLLTAQTTACADCQGVAPPSHGCPPCSRLPALTAIHSSAASEGRSRWLPGLKTTVLSLRGHQT